MIKANELRVGNKFRQPNDETIYEVLAVQEDRVAYKKEDILIEVDYWWFETDHIEPIPLTPEILEKAGFEKDSPGGWFKKGVYYLREDSIETYGFYEFYQGRYAGLKHLHQLQNLYFALTGNEVKISTGCFI